MMMYPSIDRRDFLRAAAFAGAGLLLPAAFGGCASVGRGRMDGEDAEAILARIHPPVFPDRGFPITRFGAVEGGSLEATGAIAAAIDACVAAGGGRVVIPPRRFLTGPVHLKSGVNLYVSRGATLAFVRDPRAYRQAVLTRWAGVEMMGLSAFIHAAGQQDVAVTGEGTIDGGASNSYWWAMAGDERYGWRSRMPSQAAALARLTEMAERGVPVAERIFRSDSNLRPQLIETVRCRGVLVEGVTIVNAPMAAIHPLWSQNVTVRNVRVTSRGPDNDGCLIDSSRDVLVDACTFDVAADAIAVRSGRDGDGASAPVPSTGVVIRGCTVADARHGIAIGGALAGGVRDVIAQDCTINGAALEHAVVVSNDARRGAVEHVRIAGMTVARAAGAILAIDLHEGARPSSVRDVVLRNVTSNGSAYAVYLRSSPTAGVADVTLADCRMDGVTRGNVSERVHGLRFERVTINGQLASARSHRVAPAADIPSATPAPAGS